MACPRKTFPRSALSPGKTLEYKHRCHQFRDASTSRDMASPCPWTFQCPFDTHHYPYGAHGAAWGSRLAHLVRIDQIQTLPSKTHSPLYSHLPFTTLQEHAIKFSYKLAVT